MPTCPSYGPSRRLDYELELGIWIGEGNDLGSPIPIGEAADHIAGYCLLNDWSARDVQAWEYQPLGPFLAKNFLTSVSAWIVCPEALAPFRKPMPARPDGRSQPLAYLDDAADRADGRARDPAGGDADHRANASGGRRAACPFARLRRRGDVLERRADRRSPHRQRLQPPARRPDRHGHAIHRRATAASDRSSRSAAAASSRSRFRPAKRAASSKMATR